MNFYQLGKNLLYFTLAVIVGLFIGLRIIEAHSPRQQQQMRMQQAGFFDKELDANIVEKVKSSVSRVLDRSDTLLFAIKNKDVQTALAQTHRNGKPIALLSFRNGYLIDEKGRVLSPVVGSVPNVPVITFEDLWIDLSKNQLRGELIEEAIRFLRLLRKENRILYDQISEINLSNRLGMIAYLSTPVYVPFILGRGDVARKVTVLNRFMQEYERKNILDRVKYVDFRIDGQIILKKNS